MLVLDDDQDTGESVKDLLEAFTGAQGRVATSCAQAWVALAAGDIQLVVVDYRLRETDGVAFLHELQERHPGTRAILFTGLDEIRGHVPAPIVCKGAGPEALIDQASSLLR